MIQANILDWNIENIIKRTSFIFHITFEIRSRTVGIHLKFSTYTLQPQPPIWRWGQNRQICQKILKITPKTVPKRVEQL